MRLCKIEGCERKSFGHGWCNRHYKRWRQYGDPLKILRTETGAPKKWIEWVLLQETDDCLLWPFPARKGGATNQEYGALDGNKTAHRYVCEKVNGPCPRDMESRHLCGKSLCCNKRHLIWGPHKINELDKELHGTAPFRDDLGRWRKR